MLKILKAVCAECEQDMEELELLYATGRNVKWYDHVGKQWDDFLY